MSASKPALLDNITRNYLGKGGFPLNTFTTNRYADGSVGTPPPPTPAPGNPWQEKGNGLSNDGAQG